MKTSINPCTWGGYAQFKGKKMDWKVFVREAAKSGYEGVEIGAVDAKPGEVLSYVEKQGLEVSAGMMGITYNPYAPSDKQWKASIRYAHDMGVNIMMCCGGFMPSPRRNTYAFDYDMFAGNFERAMKFADKLGMEIAFHPHRGCIVETIKETKEMVKRLPNFKICADIAHLEASGEDALKFIKTFKKKIIATHIKDYSWKKDSFIELGKGDGKLDVAACVKEFQKIGCGEWLTVELDKKWEGKNPPPAIKSAEACRRYLKSKCKV